MILRQKLRSLKPLHIFALGCIFLITLCIVLGVVPSRQPFEGQLLVQSFNFTSNQDETLFLKDVSLKEINLYGQQTLFLAGDISSPDYPQLNQYQELEIQLPNDNSTLTLIPTDTLSLEEMRLQSDQRITNLKYASYTQRLAFKLDPTQAKPATLVLEPSPEPLQVRLSNYQLQNVNLPNLPETLEFSLTTSKFDLEIPHPLQVNIQLPDQDQSIFWGNIAVKAVNFATTSQTGDNIQDNLRESTILKGEVRMAQQQQTLVKEQFLTLSPPGIQTFNRLQIVRPNPTPNLTLSTPDGNLQLNSQLSGIQVSFSGITKTLQIGLNPNLAIAKIQGSFLTRFIPQNIIVLIISFAVGLIASLLTWFLDKLDRKS